MMNEKSHNTLENNSILAPLLLFLSAYDGIHSPSSAPALPNALDAYTLKYDGKSNVKHISRLPFWERWLCAIGDLPWGQKIPFACLSSTISPRITIRWFSSLQSLLLIPLIAALFTILFIPVGLYSKRRRALATPLELDPSSYQYRLVAALRASGVRYRDVYSPLEHLERELQKVSEVGLKERFVIYDLEGREGKCNVLVRFYGDGNVIITVFGEEGSKPGLLISNN